MPTFSLPRLVLVGALASACGGTRASEPPADEASAAQPIEFSEPAVVNDVIDGDTLTVTRGTTRLRLMLKGIDTPELFSDRTPEPYADAARLFVVGRVGLRVGLEFDSACGEVPYRDCRDGFDRLLAYVRLANGEDLGSLLLGQGLARVYRFDQEIYDRLNDYSQAEHAAQEAGYGIWGGVVP